MGSKDRLYADIMAVHPEVTGSCNLVIVKQPDNSTVKFVVDCGLFQERQYSKNNESLPFIPANIDFCLVTHNHVDHVGRLPFMVNKGFAKEIYMTETTAKLLPLALEDSHKVLRDVAKRQNHSPLYSEADVSQTMRLIHPCKYNETIQIRPNIKATFFMNGHLMGASSILVQISWEEYETINLFSLETTTTRTCSSMYQTFRIGCLNFHLRWFRNPLMETWTPMRLLVALNRMC